MGRIKSDRSQTKRRSASSIRQLPKVTGRVSAERAAISLRTYADVLMLLPASKQTIGARDAVLFSALNQIADALDELRVVSGKAEAT